MRRILAQLLVIWFALVSAAIVEAARVEIILLTESGAGQQVQDWYKLLSELKVDSLQIRAPLGGEKIEIIKSGTGNTASYRIFGQLTSRQEIVLPSGRYKLSDRGRLGEWLNTLRTEGPDRALGAPRPPFGIPVEQLKPLRDEFARPIDFQTKGLPLKAFLDKVATKLNTPLRADPAATAIMAQPEKLRDELETLATGAALAAALRPAGLVLVPRLNAQKQVELAIVVPEESKEFWPIGWKPSAERPEDKILPELHEIRDVELDGVPVMELVGAVAERLKTPVLIDHNGLARQGLEPDKIKVTQTPTKTSFGLVMARMLVKAKLKYEIRIDDAGKPFIWIMSYL